MRIACLQFAPQVGDTDNNLNRADAVLAKVDQHDLDSLDLLVLPELAFSGWNFQSSNEIAPYLEPAGSGISALWARTKALQHNTNVLVGYPEKVDTSGFRQSSPKFYNSAILVNGDGETVANYRKSFLYHLDERWAEEGKGFFGGRIPGLGNTAIGICTDINPYRLEAPWHAFEFAFHILEVRASLVVVTMAWITGEECEQFTQFPNEPDMDALAYWAERLEPVIRDESRDEIIIVFCNRTGIEGDAVYSGTSAVIGILHGEVNIYGLLGRGVKDLLVVDTDEPPFANMVLRKKQVYLRPLDNAVKNKPTDDLLLTPLPRDIDPKTPSKYLADDLMFTVKRDSRPSDEQGIAEAAVPSVPETPIEEHDSILTPTAPPSPAALTKRQQIGTQTSRSVRDQMDDISSIARDRSHDRQSLGSRRSASVESSASNTPARPSSPKSRNISRLPRNRRRLSNSTEYPGLGAVYDRSQSAQARSRSAMGQRWACYDGASSDRAWSPESIPALSSGTEGSLHLVEDSQERTDFSEAHALLWEEISKVVEEHLGPGVSTEGFRGRHRSRSVGTSEARHAREQSLPREAPRASELHSQGDDSTLPCRNNRSVSAAPHTSPFASSQSGAPIRSVRDPSLGPPLDPDDEIIAEIIFRRPYNAATDSKTGSVENAASQSQATSESSPDQSDQHAQLSSRPDEDSQKTPTATRHNGAAAAAAAARQDSTLLVLQTSTEDLADMRAPHLSTASVQTPSSYEPSPVTPPPPRTYDPITTTAVTKSMVFGSDYELTLPPSIDTVSMSQNGYLQIFIDEGIASKIERPRTALS